MYLSIAKKSSELRAWAMLLDLRIVCNKGSASFIFSRASTPSKHSSLTGNDALKRYTLVIDQSSLCIQSCQFAGHSVRDQIPLFCRFCAERGVFFSIESLWSLWYSKHNSWGIYYCPDRALASKLGKVLVQLSRTGQIDINIPKSWSFSLSTSIRDGTWTRSHLYK